MPFIFCLITCPTESLNVYLIMLISFHTLSSDSRNFHSPERGRLPDREAKPRWILWKMKSEINIEITGKTQIFLACGELFYTIANCKTTENNFHFGHYFYILHNFEECATLSKRWFRWCQNLPWYHLFTKQKRLSSYFVFCTFYSLFLAGSS